MRQTLNAQGCSVTSSDLKSKLAELLVELKSNVVTAPASAANLHATPPNLSAFSRPMSINGTHPGNSIELSAAVPAEPTPSEPDSHDEVVSIYKGESESLDDSQPSDASGRWRTEPAPAASCAASATNKTSRPKRRTSRILSLTNGLASLVGMKASPPVAPFEAAPNPEAVVAAPDERHRRRSSLAGRRLSLTGLRLSLRSSPQVVKPPKAEVPGASAGSRRRRSFVSGMLSVRSRGADALFQDMYACSEECVRSMRSMRSKD